MSDGITLDVLRGFQGLGAAAAIPAAVRSVTFPTLDERGSHIKNHPRLVFWPSRSPRPVRDPLHSQLSPLVPLLVAHSGTSLAVWSPNLAGMCVLSVDITLPDMSRSGNVGVGRSG